MLPMQSLGFIHLSNCDLILPLAHPEEKKLVVSETESEESQDSQSETETESEIAPSQPTNRKFSYKPMNRRVSQDPQLLSQILSAEEVSVWMETLVGVMKEAHCTCDKYLMLSAGCTRIEDLNTR